MRETITNLLNRGVRPTTKIVGGGTESRTATGELRWNFHLQYRDDWRDKHDAFRRGLIDSDHLRIFELYAQAMRGLPESAFNSGSEWTAALSPAARAFLTALDTLYSEQPTSALKIAAIAAGSSSMHYAFTKDATRRMCDWLLHDKLSMHQRLALGMSIHANWPEIKPPEQFDDALLELFMQGSMDTPETVAQLLRPLWARRGAASSYVVSIVDDPGKLLVIGRNLKSIEPEFCKNVFRTYLFSGRIQHCGFSPSEQEMRNVAAEYYELESVLAPSSVAASGEHYFNLSQWAYRDTTWYAEVLERLYAAAQACDKSAQAAEWCRAIAMNADRQSPVFAKAMKAFARYAQDYAGMSAATDYGLSMFADFLVKTLEIANDDRVLRGRNIDLPADPGHPIVDVATGAYWGFVSWASDLPSAGVLAILVVAIERGESQFAQAAAARMMEVFDAKAHEDANVAASALGSLACNDWYTGVKDPRKSRCLGLVRQLMPVLEGISPDAAQKARLQGRNPMWDR